MGRFFLFDWIRNGNKKKGEGYGVVVDKYGASPNATMTPKSTHWFVSNTAVVNRKMRPQQKEMVFWDYKDLKRSEIQDIVTHCGCTARVAWGDKGVSAEFTHTKGDAPEGGKIYDFFLTVYLNDGVVKVNDGRGNMVWPQEKLQQTLIIKAHLMP